MMNIQFAGDNQSSREELEYVALRNKCIVWGLVAGFVILFFFAALIFDQDGRDRRHKETVERLYWENLSDGQFSSKKEWLEHEEAEKAKVIEIWRHKFGEK